MTSPSCTEAMQPLGADGRPDSGAARACATCGLPLAQGRTYCTAVCRTLQNRYARAVARVPELTAVALESEELERPEFAAREWALVQGAVNRLAVMHERIRAARRSGGLDVPDDWP